MEVQIQTGKIKGIFEKGIYAFKGIPFASPPIGEKRMLPPVPCNAWVGVKDCTNYGPRPCQLPPPWCVDKESSEYGENCLNLNIWTPAVDQEKRPVVFYIFGGGHMEGSNSESGREGHAFLNTFAEKRDFVIVAPNYRLGPFGFLYLRHILGEKYAGSGSLGLIDLILALSWVKENIAFFGGDPDNVTLVGQSAGGKAICNLLVAPSAKGLFHKAVAMSGALQSITDIDTDIKLTSNFLHSMGLADNQAETLLTCHSANITQAIDIANKIYFKAESYGPTADGVVIPQDVISYVLEGNVPDIPIMLGHTKEELSFPIDAAEIDPGRDEVLRKLVWKFGTNARHVMNKYDRLRSEYSFMDAYGKTVTEYTYIQPYLRTASLLERSGGRVYLYRWDYSGGQRANHSSDNEAIFGATSKAKVSWNPIVTQEVDRTFQRLVHSFIATGKPSADSVPEWQPYSRKNRNRMLINEVCSVASIDVEKYDRAFPLQVFRL